MRKKKKKVSGIEKLEKELTKEYSFLKRFKNKNENHLLFAAFLVVMTSMVVVNTIFIVDYVPSNHDRSNVVAATNSGKILTSLQKAKTDAYEVMVSNVTATDKADPAFAFEPTEIMLIMDISITNTSDGPQHLSPSLQFYIRDQQGGYYLMHPSSNVTNPITVDTLEPSTTVKGQLSFAIPKTLAHPLLYVDLGWQNNAPDVIDVMK